MSAYIWAGQEDFHGFVFAEYSVWSDLLEERFQRFTVQLPLSQTKETCRQAKSVNTTNHTEKRRKGLDFPWLWSLFTVMAIDAHQAAS